MRPASVWTSRERSSKRRRLDIPSDVVKYAAEAHLANTLQSLEDHIDLQVSQSYIDMQHLLLNPTSNPILVRLAMYHVHQNQEKFLHELNSDTPSASWTLRIQGQVLDPNTMRLKKHANYAVTHFIEKLEIELDPQVYPDPEINRIIWDKSTAPLVSDGFQITRAGAESCQCQIKITPCHFPPRIQLNKPLAALLGTSVDTRDNILSSFWVYIKRHALLDKKDPTRINLTPELVQIFKETLYQSHSSPSSSSSSLSSSSSSSSSSTGFSMQISDIWRSIQAVSSDPPPIIIPYFIDIKAETPVNAKCFDIAFDIPMLHRPTMFNQVALCPPDLASWQVEWAQSDRVANQSLEGIEKHNARRKVLQAYSESPVDVSNMMLDLQSHDLKALHRFEVDEHLRLSKVTNITSAFHPSDATLSSSPSSTTSSITTSSSSSSVTSPIDVSTKEKILKSAIKQYLSLASNIPIK